MEFLTHVTALAALAVVAVQQILKSLPLSFTNFANKYPVFTNFALSIVAAVLTVWQSQVVHPHAWTDWVLLVATISVVAALTYNMTIRNSTTVKSLERTS